MPENLTKPNQINHEQYTILGQFFETNYNWFEFWDFLLWN